MHLTCHLNEESRLPSPSEMPPMLCKTTREALLTRDNLIPTLRALPICLNVHNPLISCTSLYYNKSWIKGCCSQTFSQGISPLGGLKLTRNVQRWRILFLSGFLLWRQPYVPGRNSWINALWAQLGDKCRTPKRPSEKHAVETAFCGGWVQLSAGILGMKAVLLCPFPWPAQSLSSLNK